ncbi:hypothetical protein [Achromobacter xylosoxidans]|uniref:Uncharacterized protein n=1 Tax=Alcaligenes xylosoxydans xylosoxydans TaxID=85698 RepID=A0A424W5D5_ALCXX|nr:hypothetical protein [Achromobacter xylosoxidans]MBC9904792.1 hypothetical protein [Achromobacter xylosoxidans]MBD0868709.1 hypothetical protein [Achromobacter xylosoxidans]QNP87788.1 hypothetical protein IAG39_09880 [Achromobacter xylosoxidans]RPJ88437.1 hypothetical protein DY367_27915 [Achromobacter xylosoxidans]
MSKINLPPLPEFDVGILGQVKFAYSLDAMEAYAEQAVREALAAQVAKINVAMAFMSMDGVNGGPVQKEYFKAGARSAIQAVNSALIPESNHVEAADKQHP